MKVKLRKAPRRGFYGETLLRSMIAGCIGAWIGLMTPNPLPADDGGASPAKVDFAREIRPILSRNCLSCHGADAENRQANLRLDVRNQAVADRGGYHAITPGNSTQSRLVARISNPDMPMPPAATGKKLSSEEIELIKAWIDQGASYTSHWAFAKPVRPPLPAVKDTSWPRNEIDHFVLARLEAEGLAPSPEADRHTLIRRLYLDLIGIPPSPEQADAFAQDDKPDSYERVVNDLLNSPHYGERWARVWLDLARYADSQGYEKDNLRTIWPYRDWVIRALNSNMPFDRFTLEQIAGDLLPVPTRDQLIATGFHRNTMTNTEGGTDDREFRDLAVKDRVSTTMQVWMGLTAGCAQCHNHKFDPITQREFYQLYGFFNQSEDSDKDDDRPFLKVGSATSLIMRELPQDQQRATHILERGNFLNLGEKVAIAVPEAFHAFPQGAAPNRLGLAKWLTEPDNPLTARVTVNRFWAQMFGAGFVETEEDFGTQGLPPNHPQLLDWLATEFMRLDWDVKGILQKIVMSATYRQSSHVREELLEKDKFNRLLARGPRVRMEAEMVRDQALAASGLLSQKMFGPPVMPLQPDGVWQTVYSDSAWETSDGEDRYRRGLYTLWRRTSPYPSLMSFDASSREVCTLRRIRTNTPLQALVTLNDPVYVEAAQQLARRVIRKGGSSVEDRARHAFRLCLVRPPRPEELGRLVALYEEARQHFEDDLEAGRKLIHIDQSVYLDKSRIVTLLADARDSAPQWTYTSQEPVATWTRAKFNDKKWKIGSGVFGTHPPQKEDQEEKPRESYNTEWDTSDLWMRTTFRVSEPDLADFELKVSHRGKFQVYVNGKLAAEGEGASKRYKVFPLSDDAAQVLRRGKNVIAVHCRRLDVNEENSQYIDVGMTSLRPAAPIPLRKDDAEQAAWMVVSNVLLNLDETLTKR